MDFSITIDNQTGLGQMTYNTATDLMNNIYISLKVKQGSFFADPAFGSRLHLIPPKNTDSNMQLAMDYCREALQWMIDCGKAYNISVYAERDTTQNINRLKLLIEVTPAAGNKPVAFTIFIEVI